ncbi:MAG: acyl CoA:acetate/3-ketoacid CoA transferase [Cytophagales bacterium]|nr:acyl CoA:acetate/3-ketoacid CoA transferase [Rhizobacter sp.]
MSKLIDAKAVAGLIPDGSTVWLGGLAMMGFAEEIAKAIEASFLETGHPRNLTTWASGAIGNGRDGGMVHFAHPGLLKRMIAGHYGQCGAALMKMVMAGEIEAYNFPQGSLANLPQHVAARTPGLLTKVGLGTFVDPRIEGGKMNAATTESLNQVVQFAGEAWLFYPSPKINVALIRGTLADEKGNISFDKEGVLLETLSVAQAVKACGGVVIAQVERIVKAGSLHPKSVKIPGLVVDHLVISKPENHMQTISTQFNPALSGDIRVPVRDMPPMALDARKVIARRAAAELIRGAVVNLGIGVPAGVPAVAHEEGLGDIFELSVESGVNGGVPQMGGDFALSLNAESIIEQPLQFNFYDGGGIDVSCLGLAQADASGNVNVSKFSGRPMGCGGFVNITQSAKKLVFCGTFTADGLELAIGNGTLRIVKEGAVKKFVNQVEQITFSGRGSVERTQQVLFITERAVFHLTEDGLELTEIAPGVDLQRDVLAHMDFKPVMKNVRTMDAGLFQERWGGMAQAMGKTRPLH